MKKIKYKSLKISNFLSVGKDTVPIDFVSGLNQIDGRNGDISDRKNGVGKSVVINAFFFALFGETIDKIKSEFVVNNVTKGKGLVELEFDVSTAQGTKSYTIKRQVKPSKVELLEGDTDITRDSIANTNKYINELLSTNSTIHRCCDIMTIRETTPFMEMDAKDKRAFIEDIFSINVFGVMLKDLKKMISEAKKERDISSAKHTEMVRNCDSLVKQKALVEQESKERLNILQKRKDDLNKKIDQLKEDIDFIQIVDVTPLSSNVDKLNKAWVSLDGRIASSMTKIATVNASIDIKKQDIKKCSSVGGDTKCDRCLQDIPHDHIDHLNDLVKEYEADLERLISDQVSLEEEKFSYMDKKTKIQKKLGEISDEISEINKDVQKKRTLSDQLTDCYIMMDQIDDDMDSKSTVIDSFDDVIAESEKSRDEESKVLEELQLKLADLDICKFILGEEGVKSFVVKKLLDLLNNTIERYLVELGMDVRVKFDEYFEEQITGGGKVFSYKNASGAEKKSLDFACALSFSDMRRKINQVSSNVEFFDEVFDNALDAKGLDLIISVIKDRIEQHDMSVYVISHRKEMNKHIDGEIVMLEKTGKITRRVYD